MTMRARHAGFTLLELLVVIGLIAAMSFFVAGGLMGGSKSAAMQSAQATVADLVTVARTRAIASGRTTRLLINDNAANPPAYRRRLVLVEENGSNWTALHAVALPDGVYLLPRDTNVLTGTFPVAADWRTADNQKMLGSSCLATTRLPYTYDSTSSENWEYAGFTSRGTMETNAGALVLATGRGLAPAQVTAGHSPVEMADPGNVRGMQLSTYGVPRLINDRTGF
jgi:prepilin-type N-terminal cleavage/methylation domain-containing protein